MKKFLIAGTGALAILCIVVFITYSNNLVSAGKEITEFEYEYYYNDNNIGDDNMKANQNTMIKEEDVQNDKQNGKKDEKGGGVKAGKQDDGKSSKRKDGKSGKQGADNDGERDDVKVSKQGADNGSERDGVKASKQNGGRSNREDKKENAIGLDIEPESISVFVNKEYALPESYIPENLVVPDVKFYGGMGSDKNKLRQEAAEALEKMFGEALEDNIVLYGVSGYRSYARQKEIYDKNVRMRGSRATNKVSAAPGHSEHQTGLAIDISSKSLGGALNERFADLPEGRWVAENCYQYGFIIRYPENTENITGYSYEPWHLRYVGNEISEYIHNEDITLEEYYGYTLDDFYLDNIISDSGVME